MSAAAAVEAWAELGRLKSDSLSAARKPLTDSIVLKRPIMLSTEVMCMRTPAVSNFSEKFNEGETRMRRLSPRLVYGDESEAVRTSVT